MTQALETLLRPVVENALLAADMAGETYGSKASRITEKVIEALNTRKPCDADSAKVFLGPFLSAEGLEGQLLGKQAGAVYDAAVKAVASVRPCDAGLREDARWLRELAVLMRNRHEFTEGPRHAERIERIAAAIAALSKGDAKR